MKMVVEMINPKIGERVADTSCGTGGFVVTAMTHVISQIEQSFVAEMGEKKKIGMQIPSERFRIRFPRSQEPISLDLILIRPS